MVEARISEFLDLTEFPHYCKMGERQGQKNVAIDGGEHKLAEPVGPPVPTYPPVATSSPVTKRLLEKTLWILLVHE